MRSFTINYFYYDEYTRYCSDCCGPWGWMTGGVLWIQENTNPKSIGFQKKNGKGQRD